MNGREVQLYTFGALCAALDRPQVTVRLWETSRYLPPAPFRAEHIPGKGGTTGRRYYPLEAITACLEEFQSGAFGRVPHRMVQARGPDRSNLTEVDGNRPRLQRGSQPLIETLTRRRLDANQKKAPQGDDYAATASTEDDVFEEENPDEIAEFSQSRSRGWGAADEKVESSKSSGGKTHFKFSEDQELIAFVEGEPIDIYDQHWIKRQGQMSFRCADEDCPLCEAGDSPSSRFTFSILHFEEENGEINPRVKLMTVGTKALKQLRAIDEDPKRGGPLEGSSLPPTAQVSARTPLTTSPP